MTDARVEGETARRRAGRPRTVDRERIVETARRLDPETLTMQSLADEIGVGRKTLHYHVSDREELLRIVAEATLQQNLLAQPTVATDDWRLAIRAFATSTRDAIIASGGWVHYVRFDGGEALVHLETAEATLQTLEAAGFPDDTAALALGLAAEFSLTSAKDALARQQRAHHPQRDELRRTLGSSVDGRFTSLRRLGARDWDEFGSDRQFEFDLTVLTLGLEQLLRPVR